MTGAALAALLAAAAQATLGAPQPAETATVAGSQGGWRMQVFTHAKNDESPPVIGYLRCTIRRPGLLISYGGNGGADLETGGAGAAFAASDIVALELGGAGYEARLIGVARPRRYADVDYPAGFVEPPAPATPQAYLGVRRGPREPWVAAATLIDEMLDAPSLTIRHRAGAGEARHRVPLAGLRRAFAWCGTAMASDRARRLRPR
jgi:hypothetical protein